MLLMTCAYLMSHKLQSMTGKLEGLNTQGIKFYLKIKFDKTTEISINSKKNHVLAVTHRVIYQVDQF